MNVLLNICCFILTIIIIYYSELIYKSFSIILVSMKKRIIVIMLLLIYLLLNTQCSMILNFNEPSRIDANVMGWTEFSPSSNSRIIYISNTGDDENAAYYSSTDSEIGDDPFQPTDAILPFATYDAAEEYQRDGYDDWLLFERDGTFEITNGALKSGVDEDHKSLIGAYGAGNLPIVRPTLSESITDYTCYEFIFVNWPHDGDELAHSAITSLNFYNEDIDPNVGTIEKFEGTSALSLRSGHYGDMYDILIEGCRFQYIGATIGPLYGDGTASDFTFNRCQFLDRYVYTNEDGHSQGMYGQYIDGLRFYECLWDHNGWLNSVDSGETVGVATKFNHNFYFSSCSNVYLINNISMRPSSMCFKFTENHENPADYASNNIYMINNLMVDGEIGVSIGGNTTDPYRFKNVNLLDNVLTKFGESNQTGRGVAWGFDCVDWESGIVEGNYLIDFSTNATNIFGIELISEIKDTIVRSNMVSNIGSGTGHIKFISDEGTLPYQTNIYIYDNVLSEDREATVAGYDNLSPLVGLYGNSYYSESESPIESEGINYSYNDWVSSNEKDAKNSQVTIGRTIEDYDSLVLGGDGTYDSFIEKIREQSRDNWDTDLTAGMINTWLRAGVSN